MQREIYLALECSRDEGKFMFFVFHPETFEFSYYILIFFLLMQPMACTPYLIVYTCFVTNRRRRISRNRRDIIYQSINKTTSNSSL